MHAAVAVLAGAKLGQDVASSLVWPDAAAGAAALAVVSSLEKLLRMEPQSLLGRLHVTHTNCQLANRHKGNWLRKLQP